jgi:uncharacterized membrane protein
MTPGNLFAFVTVPLFGALLCIAPSRSRPGLHFGVRVPASHADAAVISAQHRAYLKRAITIAVCCTVAAAIVLGGHAPWWVSRIVLLAEAGADVGCFWLARRKITAAKNAEGWFTGLKQAIVADTSWRSSPERFPLRWLLPAIAVIAATVITGAIRYPNLPTRLVPVLARLDSHAAPRSVVGAFSLVIVQVYVTGMGAALLALAYRARPDIDPAAPAASVQGYRAALRAVGRALLVLLALTDASMLIGALEEWRIYRLSGPATALIPAPFAAGMLVVAIVVARAARAAGWRTGVQMAAGPLAVGGRHPNARVASRDDDRLWKAGLIYVSRADPAVIVPARVGFGWTLNFGNPLGWLVIAAIAIVPLGLAAVMTAVGA